MDDDLRPERAARDRHRGYLADADALLGAADERGLDARDVPVAHLQNGRKEPITGRQATGAKAIHHTRPLPSTIGLYASRGSDRQERRPTPAAAGNTATSADPTPARYASHASAGSCLRRGGGPPQDGAEQQEARHREPRLLRRRDARQ